MEDAEKGRDKWIDVLESVVQAVVSIRVLFVRSFDTDNSGYSVATGFVVDAKRGLILTNRHVVSPGPVLAEAVFHNHEVVCIYPIYRDPVHDFGLYRFDPSQIQHMSLREIALAPHEAVVGRQIRVVGNDAGEKLSILAGTLARMDRKAPDYGAGNYNDFNTFYYQAASSTSGGSSGSPVININGNAVALNAGGAVEAASSYYLPLHRVVRALSLLQENKPVTRGTIQAIFVHRSYEESRRLGLRKNTEIFFREKFPESTGMLVAQQIVPSGPADIQGIAPGDVLIKINDQPIFTFVHLEETLDASVGATVSLEVQRGGEMMSFQVEVQDLHSITPARFLTVGGTLVHALSYQQARAFTLPTGGVFVSSAGYFLRRALIKQNCVITAVNGIATPDLDTFEAAVTPLSHLEPISLSYFYVKEKFHKHTKSVTMMKRWHETAKGCRLDGHRFWKLESLPEPTRAFEWKASETDLDTPDEPPASVVAPSLVMVTFSLPYWLSGVHERDFLGVGLIIDKENGLVVVDRNTVPVSIGDPSIDFGGALEVPGKIVFIHPIHNFAVIKYDPVLIGDTPVREARLLDEPPVQGDDIHLTGLSRDSQCIRRESEATEVTKCALPKPQYPRFRAINEEVIFLDYPVDSCLGGVLSNDDGDVLSLWGAYSYYDSSQKQNTEIDVGQPTRPLMQVLPFLRRGVVPLVRDLQIELETVTVSTARKLGLSAEWIGKLNAVASRSQRQVLVVNRVAANSHAAEVLKEGDLVLSVNGRCVTTFRDVERAYTVAVEPSTEIDTTAQVVVFRGSERVELTFDIRTALLRGYECERVVGWSGCILQDAPYAVAQLGYSPPGVYCSCYLSGSPAHQYNLTSCKFIVEINGKPTPTLDDLVAALKETQDKMEEGSGREAFVRVKTMSLDEKPEVLTIRPNYHYWPLWELVLEEDEWQLVNHSGTDRASPPLII